MSGYEILGPAPASILRVSNRYRWQILPACSRITATVAGLEPRDRCALVSQPHHRR